MSDDVAADEVAQEALNRPHPVITPDSEKFWISARAHELRLPRCAACSMFFFPPAPFCPRCWSDEIHWDRVSGLGRVFSFVTFQRLYDRSFEDLLPYSVAVIELDEGPRLLSRLTGAQEPTVDAPVEIVYEDLDEMTTLPLFRVVGEPSRSLTAGADSRETTGELSTRAQP